MEPLTLSILVLLYFTLFIAFFWITVLVDNYEIIWHDPKAKNKYFISVLIPAYNEEKGIKKTIESILNQNYPKNKYEIIVVNDGSTDNTKKICIEFQKKGLIKLINKSNGGKASALNIGIQYTKGELIYILDADSFADKNSFSHLIGYFDNKKVAAVTSSMKITEKKRFLQKIQWLEYLFGILMRKVMSLFNSLYVTPGPGSIYRKSVILEVGGFSTKTLTEDMEIAFNIQDHGYVIESSLNSIVHTTPPKGIIPLIKQRRRWYTGFIEDSVKYRHFYFNKNKGFLGRFLLPTNVLSTFSLLFLVLYSFYTVAKTSFLNISKVSAINFDIVPMIRMPDFFSTLFGINIFTVLGILFFVISLFIIYYSVRVSNEKLDLKNNFLDYIFYLFFYSILMAVFWSDSILYKLFFREKERVWKNG